ncbi:MAG TPA: TMEM165/GDT1 family protein [Acidobacteriota bacterium]|nr:TMEM165/GDT1 family protein [Acidobacteriota bacterium]
MKTLWLTFVTLFLAELGDKTQLAVITLTSRTKDPVWVFVGASAALIIVTLLGVVAGEALVRIIPVSVIKKAAAAAFVIIGILMFFDKL